MAKDIDLDALRERRAVLADMLKHGPLFAHRPGTNGEDTEAFKKIEKEYAENGAILEAAAKAAEK